MEKTTIKVFKKKNQEKIFFGHPEFDAILNNKLKKGTMILIEEDIPTSMYLQLIRYYIGSGIHQDQNCILYDVFEKRWESMIPQKQRESSQKKQEVQEKGEQKSNNDIAWRYDSQKIKLKDLQVSDDIPKLDLSKSFKDEKQLLFTKSINEFQDLKTLYMDVCENLQNCLASENDTKLKKICITNLFGHFSKVQYKLRDLIKFCQGLKALARASHVLLLVTIPQALPAEFKNILHFYFDIVTKIEPLLEREELEHFHGLLHFQKLPNISNFKNFSLETLSWGIKANSKRKLEIDRLYLAPEREDQSELQQKEKLEF